MTRSRQSGFVLLFVMVLIGWLGVAIVVLSDACGTMVFSARGEYLEACTRNLTASARAWAEHHSRGIGGAAVRDRRLDVGDLAVRDASVVVSIASSDGKAREVQVGTRCRRGKQTLRRRGTHLVGPGPKGAVE